jgi:hypothetical protein
MPEARLGKAPYSRAPQQPIEGQLICNETLGVENHHQNTLISVWLAPAFNALRGDHASSGQSLEEICADHVTFTEI